MKTKVLFVALLAMAALNVMAQNSGSDVISHDRTGNDSRIVMTTNSMGETFSLNEVARQIQELQRVVNQTIPMLEAVAEIESGSSTNVTASTGGVLAGILGGILRGNTNASSDTASTGSTNGGFANILRDVLGGTSTNNAPASESTFNDIVVLRQHLQQIRPVLQRLERGDFSQRIVQPGSQRATDGLAPTGRTSKDDEE
jgi:hypothetical protein